MNTIWSRATWHDARVIDQDGNLVARFATEAMADAAIREHNTAPAMLALIKRIEAYARSQTRSEPLADIERSARLILLAAEGR